MDPLTHTLTGLAIARTRLGRVTPLAGAALVVGANLPDIDVASYMAGTDAAAGFRRGWTHGPVALLLLPVLWTAILVLWSRRRAASREDPVRPRWLLGLSCLGCWSHPALDWLNTYGIRLLMPFDDTWFYGDAMFIVDPWMWLLLGGAGFLTRKRGRPPYGWLLLTAAAAALLLLAGSIVPAGARAAWAGGIVAVAAIDRALAADRRCGIAALSLAVAALYAGSLLGISRAGAVWARTELARQGVAGVERIMVGPMPANPLRWEVVAETSDVYRYGALRWLPERRLQLEPRSIPHAPVSPAAAAALAAPGVAGTVGWMRFPFTDVELTPGGYIVHIMDARYVRERSGGFGTVDVDLDRNLSPLP